jgi:formate/nitrite transporter FocA (FNT family)
VRGGQEDVAMPQGHSMVKTEQTGRLSAAEIFERTTTGAEEEIRRPFYNLTFSGVAAGLSMGISGLGVATVLSVFAEAGATDSPMTQLVAYLLYPLGFLVVILGRQQLFTENTLFPVALVLESREHLAATAKLWGAVLAANIVGTLMFAALAVLTPAVPDAIVTQLQGLGVEAGSQGFARIFWTGVVGGWLIALVAWLVTASTTTTGQLLVIFVLTYAVGLGHFAHSVAGGGEVLSAVLAGEIPLTSYLTWITGAVLGNAVGGVVIVALFAYGQVQGAPESLDSKPDETHTPEG